MGRDEYRRLNNQLRRETDQARKLWLTKQCEEIENLDLSGQMDIVYRKVKQLTSTKGNGKGQNVLKDRQGNTLTEAESIRARWKEYIEELCAKNDKPVELPIEEQQQINDDDLGPSTNESELTAVIERPKEKKAEGDDGIPVEFIKALNASEQEEFFNICMDIYQRGEWPDDFCKSILVPLEKMKNATRCEDHRTISLITHAS